jgi:hypothetical protein
MCRMRISAGLNLTGDGRRLLSGLELISGFDRPGRIIRRTTIIAVQFLPTFRREN